LDNICQIQTKVLRYPFPKFFGTKQGLTVVLLLRFYRVGPNRSSPRIDRGKTVWGRAGGWRLAVKLCSLLTFTISGPCVWWTGPCGSSSCRSGKWMAAAAQTSKKAVSPTHHQKPGRAGQKPGFDAARAWPLW
jgi:hypothetical protein